LKVLRRGEVEKKLFPGRALQLVVGREDAASSSRAITMGFAHYSAESGRMEPHRHAEEVVLILGCKNGWIRFGGFGDRPEEMREPFTLEEGMILHIPESEWHVFEYEENGYVDIAFFYGQADICSRKK